MRGGVRAKLVESVLPPGLRGVAAPGHRRRSVRVLGPARCARNVWLISAIWLSSAAAFGAGGEHLAPGAVPGCFGCCREGRSDG